ncbi:MAG: DUF2975 domain-containing protein [Acutalibacteraceae bacterium]
MEQKTLSRWLKCIVIGLGICGLIIYAVVIPSLGKDIIERYAEFSYWYTPWLVFLWITGVPCFVALFLGWRVAKNIGLDKSFSNENAVIFKWVSVLAAGDSLLFFIGNIIFLLLDMNHPSVLIMSFMIIFIGIAVAIAAAVLSRLIKKAAVLQDQSDLTI